MYRPDEGWKSCDCKCETCSPEQNQKCDREVTATYAAEDRRQEKKDPPKERIYDEDHH